MNNPDFDINLNNSSVENEKTYFEIELNGGVRGLKGDKGDNGYSPTVELNKEGTVTELKITDKNGVHTANIYDGVGGDMNRSVYDTDNNGIVDNAEMVNNHTVDADVPEGAVFTDTKYTAGTGIEITQDNVIRSLSTAPFWGSIQGTIDNQTDLKNALDSKVNSSDIPDLNSFVTKDTTELENYELKSNTGSSIALSIDSSTYIMTLSLKNSSGNILNTQTIDLPLETMVVGASYDNTTKEIILTLKSGATTRFSVADLVNGLQTEITSSNKLSSDLVDDTNNTNKFVSESEKTTWNNKYNKPSEGIPKTDLENNVQATLEKVSTLESDIEDIDDVLNGESTTTAEGSTISLTNTLNSDLKLLEIEGNSTQNGTPTPDSPKEIQNVTGEQTITISDGINSIIKKVNLGKNLFDKNNANILNCYFNENGVKANNDTRSIYIKCKPNTTYTMQKYGSVRFRLGATTEIPSAGVSVSNLRNIDTDGIITITTGSNSKYLVAYIYATFDTNEKTLEEVLDTIQIEEGSEATTYSKYFTPIELNKIGNYKDKIYKEDGTWYIEKKTGSIVLNGNETGWNFQARQNNVYRGYITVINGSTSTGRENAISNYFYSKGGTDESVGNMFINSSQLFLYTDITNIADFKTWLSTHNTEVIYPLNTPKKEEITNETLISQLEELKNTYMYKDTTNITTTGNLPAILNIEAYTDTLDGRYESAKTKETGNIDTSNYYTKSQVNSKLEDVYSTNEVKTNKVWNGKPVYRTVFYFASVTFSGNSYIYTHNISNIDEVLPITGKCKSGSVTMSIPFTLSTAYISCYGSSTDLFINSNRSGDSKFYIIFEYTKTTD